MALYHTYLGVQLYIASCIICCGKARALIELVVYSLPLIQGTRIHMNMLIVWYLLFLGANDIIHRGTATRLNF